MGKLWSNLFTEFSIIPLPSMNFVDQMNSLTRLVLIIFAVMVLLDFKQSLSFLVIALTFIIILYNIERTKMKKAKSTENYNGPSSSGRGEPVMALNTFPIQASKPSIRFSNSHEKLGYARVNIDTGERLLFVNDTTQVGANSDTYVSKNYLLSRGQNPITKIPPIIVPKSHDMTYWRSNNNIVNSHVNDIRSIDNYSSGYAVSDCCDTPIQIRKNNQLRSNGLLPGGGRESCSENYIQAPTPMEPLPMIPGLEMNNGRATISNNVRVVDNMREGYAPEMRRENYIQAPTPMEPIPMVPGLYHQNGKGNISVGTERSGVRENYIQAPTPMEPIPMVPGLYHQNGKGNMRENYFQRADPQSENGPRDTQGIKPNRTGWVDTAPGYNTFQPLVNLPANLAVGSCPQNEQFSEYNKNMFKQTLQPGVYSTNDVIEPISSNIGISFQQQFEPQTMKINNNGSVDFHEYDPRRVEVEYEDLDMNRLPPTESTVYDPRFSGYGTSYRSYTHDVTGQTRYAYDDVEAIRNPNYITRSKVDFIPEADQYGPMKVGQEWGQNLSHMRDVANNRWANDSLSFRNGMMESLMRKRNSEMWQKRMAPTYN